jgi:hypothetical protein
MKMKQEIIYLLFIALVVIIAKYNDGDLKNVYNSITTGAEYHSFIVKIPFLNVLPFEVLKTTILFFSLSLPIFIFRFDRPNVIFWLYAISPIPIWVLCHPAQFISTAMAYLFATSKENRKKIIIGALAILAHRCGVVLIIASLAWGLIKKSRALKTLIPIMNLYLFMFCLVFAVFEFSQVKSINFDDTAPFQMILVIGVPLIIFSKLKCNECQWLIFVLLSAVILFLTVFINIYGIGIYGRILIGVSFIIILSAKNTIEGLNVK